MPLVLASFLGGLAYITGSLVGRVLLALGMGYITYKGFSVLTDNIYSRLQDAMSGMPSDIVSFIAYLWVDKAIALMFSAYTAALAVRLAGGTTLTALKVK